MTYPHDYDAVSSCRHYGQRDGVTIIASDYDHAGAIASTLATARTNADGNLVIVYQPHPRTSVRDVQHRLTALLDGADEVILVSARNSSAHDGTETRRPEGWQRLRVMPDAAAAFADAVWALEPGDAFVAIGLDCERSATRMCDHLSALGKPGPPLWDRAVFSCAAGPGPIGRQASRIAYASAGVDRHG